MKNKFVRGSLRETNKKEKNKNPRPKVVLKKLGTVVWSLDGSASLINDEINNNNKFIGHHWNL